MIVERCLSLPQYSLWRCFIKVYGLRPKRDWRKRSDPRRRNNMMTPSTPLGQSRKVRSSSSHIIKEGDEATSVVSQPLFSTVPF